MKQAQIKAVLFDMDGLIFDTETVIKQCWQQAAAEMGYPIDEQLYSQFIGVQDPQCERMLQNAFGSDFSIESFRQRREQKLDAIRNNQGFTMKPGFRALMAELAERGIRSALVTSSPRDHVEHNFRQMPELAQFEALITAESVTCSKPDPEGYLLGCKKLGISPHEALVLEDSNNGMRAGLRAGCQAIMVPDILPPEADVSQTALAVVSDLTQVQDYIASTASVVAI